MRWWGVAVSFFTRGAERKGGRADDQQNEVPSFSRKFISTPKKYEVENFSWSNFPPR
jgi:hypothetical protein